MKKCRELVATTAAVASLIGLCLSARADVTMTLIDAGAYAQANVFGLVDNSTHQNIISGLDVGVYEFNVNGNHNVWGVCISPGGYVDWNPHNYSVQTFATAGAIGGLNSPPITTEGLQAAGWIMNTWEASALAGGKNTAMAFTAAIYSVLFSSSCTVNTTGCDQTFMDAYNKYKSGIQLTYAGYIYAPNPATSGQSHDLYGSYYGQ